MHGRSYNIAGSIVYIISPHLPTPPSYSSIKNPICLCSICVFGRYPVRAHCYEQDMPLKSLAVESRQESRRILYTHRHRQYHRHGALQTHPKQLKPRKTHQKLRMIRRPPLVPYQVLSKARPPITITFSRPFIYPAILMAYSMNRTRPPAYSPTHPSWSRDS